MPITSPYLRLGPLTIAITLAALFLQTGSRGQAELIPAKNAPAFFPGANQLILTWTNHGSEPIEVEITGRVFQAASALALELPVELKEKLRLFPHQTALLPVAVTLPETRGKSRWVIRWEDAARKLVGKSEVTVYPRAILRELEAMAGGKPLGIFSAEEEFRRAFENGKAKFEKVEADQVRGFEGRLLILKGFPIRGESLKETLLPAARRGVVAVCVVPENTGSVPRPNFYATTHGAGALVFVQEQAVENFETNPEAQLRLVEICRLATKPGRPDLPIILSKDDHEN